MMRFALVCLLVGCGAGRTSEDDAAVDSVAVDSVAVDSVADSVAVDSVAVGSVDVYDEDVAVDSVAVDSVEDIALDSVAVDSVPVDSFEDVAVDSLEDVALDSVAVDSVEDTALDSADTSDADTEEPADDIFGTRVPRADAWWVGDGRIHYGDQTVRLRGINWFGLETPDRALHGTWFGRTVDDFLAEIRSFGFDALRVPVSPESINPGFASAAWAAGAYRSGPATTGREHLERLLDAAAAAGLRVLLDFHACDSAHIGGALPGRPDGCPGYDVARWQADLATLAGLAVGRDHVVGVDLCNEPHALTWAAWKALAEAGAEAVLRADPRILVFVEGVAGASDFAGNYPFWGENLTSAALDPPAIPGARLVYAPHTYGPGVSAQAYFNVAGFPANMPAIWRAHFGHLAPAHPVVAGEFGGRYDDAVAVGEVAWNEAFVAWLATLDRGAPTSFFYWALNPNSGDTGGLYEDDWVTVDTRRLTLLAPLLAP